MMKKILKIISLSLLVLCLATINLWFQPAVSSAVTSIKNTPVLNQNGIYGGPTLTVNILSPAEGAVFQTGQCFDVQARVCFTCPSIADSSGPTGFPFVKPVYACAAEGFNIKAAISITGNAMTSDPAIRDVADSFTCGLGPQCVINTVSWRVCCTGAGPVRITVSPSGQYTSVVYNNQPGSDWLIKPVYANPSQPIPAEHLISATVNIMQVEAKKPFEESSYSGAGPSDAAATPADTMVLTASVQTEQVIAGQPVKIMANVVNRGDLEGSLTAKLTINGRIEDSKQLIIPGNSGRPIEFTILKDKPGTYSADINGQQAYFTVVAAGDNNNSKTIAYTIIGVIGTLAILFAIALFMRRRLSA